MDLSFHKQGIQYLKCLIYMIIYTITSMIFPGILSLVIDKGIAVKNVKYICIYIICFFLTGLLIVVFQYFQRVGFFQFTQELVVHLKNKIVTRFLQANLNFWKNHSIGDMYTVVENDIPKLEVLLTTLISDTVVNLIILLGTLFILVNIDPFVGFSLFFMALITAFLQKNIGKRVKSGTEDIRQQLGNQSSFTNEILNYATHIQIKNLASKAKERYVTNNKNILVSQVKQNRMMVLSKNVGMLYNVFSMITVIIVGSIKVYNDSITIGILFSLILYAQNLYVPIVGIGNTYVTMKSIAPLVNKVLEIMENDCLVKGGELFPDKVTSGNICFNHVFYRYSNDCDFQINDLTFHLKTGEIMGIVGGNGCGKSTIVKMLSLLIVPEQGNIELDGVSIEKYDIKYLREQMGFMLQDIYLENDSLEEILMNNDERVKKLVCDFEIDKIISDKGAETKIEENSSNLSGGEKQKIAIAKLFIDDKPIYILDEPTSAMDLVSEIRMCKILKEYLKNKTAMIITHRPEILKICDNILEL